MESIIPSVNNKECGKSSINIYSTTRQDITINTHLDDVLRVNLLAPSFGEALEQDVKTKKTNSTGDMTPNRSMSMTSDMLDQLFINEGFLDQRNRIQNINEEHDNIFKAMKLKEYKQRETQNLNQFNKLSYTKKPFKEVFSKVSGIFDNVDKYFNLPKKMKDPTANKFVLKVVKEKDI